jgi:anti-sigma factor RsiW
VAELLPFLLNGSLDADERREVLEHTRACAQCSSELLNTVFVWMATDSHPPAEVLVDFAQGEVLDDYPREVLEEHLASCPICEQAVEAVALSQSSEFQPSGGLAGSGQPSEEPSAADSSAAPAPERSPPSPDESTRFAWAPRSAAVWLRVVAVALLAALAGGLLVQIMGRGTVQVNFETAELFPADHRFRSGDGEVPPGSDPEFERAPRFNESASLGIVLVPAETPGGTSVRALVQQADGETVLTIAGLQQTETGDFSILLPAKRLPAGRYVVIIEEAAAEGATGWRSLGEYRMVIE